MSDIYLAHTLGDTNLKYIGPTDNILWHNMSDIYLAYTLGDTNLKYIGPTDNILWHNMSDIYLAYTLGDTNLKYIGPTDNILWHNMSDIYLAYTLGDTNLKYIGPTDNILWHNMSDIYLAHTLGDTNLKYIGAADTAHRVDVGDVDGCVSALAPQAPCYTHSQRLRGILNRAEQVIGLSIFGLRWRRGRCLDGWFGRQRSHRHARMSEWVSEVLGKIS